MSAEPKDIRGQIAAEAKSWLSTPFVHQAHLKGVGVDCLGLIGQTAINCGLVPADSWQTTWAEHAGYANVPANGVLQSVCHRYLRPIMKDSAQIGSVVLIRYAREPQHLAFLVPYLHGGLSLIHALGPKSPGKVVEHGFDLKWQRRVVEAFELPGVN
jgi:cell wall-associated NlpC family hydrolase